MMMNTHIYVVGCAQARSSPGHHAYLTWLDGCSPDCIEAYHLRYRESQAAIGVSTQWLSSGSASDSARVSRTCVNGSVVLARLHFMKDDSQL
jgi:hypothetical protein